MQRVRVGLTGLAFVLLLIGLASAILNSASRERPVSVIGGPKPAIVAELSNSAAPADPATAEPLAELGLTPSTEPDNQSDAAAPARAAR